MRPIVWILIFAAAGVLTWGMASIPSPLAGTLASMSGALSLLALVLACVAD